jgi:ribonuclease P protein component
MALPRLKRRREFLRVAERGKRAGRPGLVLQALGGTGGPLRVGFTATKKLGGAVVRNRTKRRLREAARLVLTDPLPGWDLVLIGREATATRRFADLLADLRGALSALGVTAREPRP